MTDNSQQGFLRLSQVLSIIPVGKTTWYNGVKSGRYPPPIKIGARITAWKVTDIQNLISSLSEGKAPSLVT